MSFVDWQEWEADEDERALAVERAEDDQRAEWDREDRETDRAGSVPARISFDQQLLGLAPRERQQNRRTVGDVVIGGLLTAATLTTVVLAVGLFALAVELLP